MNQEEIIQKLQVAMKLYQAKDLNAAEVIFKEILDVNPKEQNALHLLGCIHKDRGELQQAVDLIQASIREDTSNPITFLNLGEALVAAGQYENAVEVFKESLKRNQQMPQTWFCLASALVRTGNFDQACACVVNTYELDNNFGGGIVSCGKDLAISRDFYFSRLLLQQALKRGLDPIAVNWYLGNISAELFEYSHAIKYYQTSLLAGNDHPYFFVSFAEVLRRSEDDLEYACSLLKKVIKQKPDFSDAYMNLGRILKEQGEVEEAIHYCRKSIEINPDSAEAYMHLGNAYEQNGLFDESLCSLLTSVRLEPKLRLGLYSLFSLYLHRQEYNVTPGNYMQGLPIQILNSLRAKRCICFGDCHVAVFDGVEGFESVWVGAATAYNLTAPQSFTGGRDKILSRLEGASPDDDVVLLSFGEVDIRANIIKHSIIQRRSIEEVCTDIVARYFDFADEILLKDFRVIIYGPWGSGSDHNNQGTMQERYYSSCCLDSLLYEKAKSKGIIYFSLHEVFSNHLLQSTRMDFFDATGMHFHGHPDNISPEVKSVVLSQMLKAINGSERSLFPCKSPALSMASLLSKETLCLLDVFSSDSPSFHRLGLIPSGEERVRVLSKAKSSIVLELGSCLNLQSCHLKWISSMEGLSLEGWEVWGLNESGEMESCKMMLSRPSLGSVNCNEIKAEFVDNSMLRYLVLTFPEGVMRSLESFEIIGRRFVFS